MDRHKASRIKVQQYAEEQVSVWEDVKHGLVFGSQDFIEDIKARFLSEIPNAELLSSGIYSEPTNHTNSSRRLPNFSISIFNQHRGRKRLRSSAQKE